jgi:hypothetical protein
MSKATASALIGRRARGARALSCLLLFLITYGATLGVIHRHGPSGPPGVAAESAAKSVSGGGQTGTPSSGLPFRPGDCSICQFQRQLNSGLLYTPVFVLAPESHPAPAHVAPASYLSAATTPRRGRAPPQLSLV